MLKIAQLSLHYGNIPALHQISLEVANNEVVALLGSNGAGKTSTLKSISGLVNYVGQINYEDKDLAKIAPHRRIEMGIAHVPEGRGIFGDLTVYENLRLASWGSAKVSYDYVYQLFPILQTRSQQLACTLSGGEQQMLAIARALMRKPKLLLLDEPSMGLSPKLMAEVFAALKIIHDEGVSILLVEQNIHLALQLAHRAYVLENGKIALSGEAKNFINDPKLRELYLA